MRNKTISIAALTIIAAALPGALAAQEASGDLATSDLDSLRSAIQSRYDAALTATRSDDLISADDPRYMWASQAKVQCAIALGYLKSNTRDETSISKCDFASRMMRMAPRPPAPVAPPPAPPPPPRPDICQDRQPAIVFFDFDVDVPGDDAQPTIEFMVNAARTCGWSSFKVVGHTDRAGSDAYNDALSMRRAESIAQLMMSMGISRAQMAISAEGESNPRVPTEDGVRSPQNRRVEITVSQ